jgi:hypothetical protein
MKTVFGSQESGETLENTKNISEFVRKKITQCYYNLDAKYYE